MSSSQSTATSDDAGAYRFDGVAPGNAELTFRLLNFSVLRRTAAVARGASVTANVVLTLSLSADVIVTGTGSFRNVADVEDPAANLVGVAASGRRVSEFARPRCGGEYQGGVVREQAGVPGGIKVKVAGKEITVCCDDCAKPGRGRAR